MTWVAIIVAGGAAATSATIAGAQYVKGKNDAKKAEKNRPKYEIPAEIGKNLTAAENYAAQTSLQGIPEEQKQQYLSNLQRSSAYGLSQLGTRNAGLAGVANINENQNQGYADLLSQDSAARISNQRYGQQLVGAANQTMADYKGQSFQLNKLNPYYEKTAQDQARNAALFQNLSNGASSFGSAAAGANFGGGAKKSSMNQSQSNPYPYSNNSFSVNQQNAFARNNQTAYRQDFGAYNNPQQGFGYDPNLNNPYGGNAGSYLNPNDNIFVR